MGVPITFMDKYNPNQFEIIGTSTTDMPKGAPYVNGKRIYERILIRRKQNTSGNQSEDCVKAAAEPSESYGDNV